MNVSSYYLGQHKHYHDKHRSHFITWRTQIICLYIDPSVLKHWLKVTKPNGIILFSVKTRFWKKWEEEHERLEHVEQAWNQIWISDPPIPYLPSLVEHGKHCAEEVKLYMYRKCN